MMQQIMDISYLYHDASECKFKIKKSFIESYTCMYI